VKYLRNRFIAGLLILLPSVVTGWVLWKIFNSVDNLLKPIQERYPVVDFPGVGFVVVVLLILLTGVFAGNFIGRRVIGTGEQLLARVPVVRRIYIAVKEISQVFLADRKMVFKEVVLIRYPHRDSWVLGFVTQSAAPRLSQLVGRDLLNVFIPTTPNPTSGFLLFVPADDVIRIPISVEEALKAVVSGGAYTPPPLAGASVARDGKV
jgi:uncharacterized membrane protein